MNTHRKKQASTTLEQPMLMRRFSQSLPMALLNAREGVMNQFRPMLRRHELTEQQWRVIRALVEVKEIDAREIARRSCILAPSLSRILQNLENRRLIKRRSAKDDQRRSLISISPQGRALFETIAPESEALYAAIENAFGQRRTGELYRLLAELESVLMTQKDSPSAELSVST